ncbi:hypothetical protein L9F63_024440, partial [Diploptera punctata]
DVVSRENKVPALSNQWTRIVDSVSWIRHRDIHILTVGGYTYTSDQRFQANHHRDNEEWTLQIKWAQKRDAGIYECQISTQPVRSYFVNLNIVGHSSVQEMIHSLGYRKRRTITHNLLQRFRNEDARTLVKLRRALHDKRPMRGQRYETLEDIRKAGIFKLVERWRKCLYDHHTEPSLK